MGIRLVAIDLDGTLFNSDVKLTERVVNTLRKAMEKDVKIVITTGRAMSGVVEGVLEKVGLYEKGNYVITSNGAIAQKTDSGEKIFYRSLTVEDFGKFEKMCKKLGIHIQMIAEDSIYTPDREIHKLTVREAYLTDTNLNYATFNDLPKDIDIIKMMLVGEKEILD